MKNYQKTQLKQTQIKKHIIILVVIVLVFIIGCPMMFNFVNPWIGLAVAASLIFLFGRYTVKLINLLK